MLIAGKKLAGEARFLVLAVSSTDVRDRARELGAFLDGSHIVVHAIGALAAPDNARVSEVIAQGMTTQKIGVLAGRLTPSASSSLMCFSTAAASRPVQPAITA